MPEMPSFNVDIYLFFNCKYAHFMIVRKTGVQRLFLVLHNFSLILIISMFSTVLMCAYVLR